MDLDVFQAMIPVARRPVTLVYLKFTSFAAARSDALLVGKEATITREEIPYEP